ncbi:MAG: hypothetical protein ACI3XC_07335 [Phascolarctobacterium sp.]
MGDTRMFRMDKWNLKGWLYFFALFALIPILPEWTGRENGIIENLQLLWLVAGMIYCWHMRKVQQIDWGGSPSKLWSAGVIYFFLLFMREISWGRVFFTEPNGSMIQYQHMGLYGKLVHPLVGALIALSLVLVVKAKIWRVIKLIKLPIKSFFLLVLFIAMTWIGEKGPITCLHSQITEELAEFGAYMMMYYITRDLGSRMQQTS